MVKMDSKEILERNIAYMQRTIPPDDIYLFAELNYDASVYILKKLDECIDVYDEMQEDELFNKIVRNITSYHLSRRDNKEVSLDLGIYDNN